jgi:hypothetical protein
MCHVIADVDEQQHFGEGYDLSITDGTSTHKQAGRVHCAWIASVLRKKHLHCMGQNPASRPLPHAMSTAYCEALQLDIPYVCITVL